jgi:hypothetical protein
MTTSENGSGTASSDQRVSKELRFDRRLANRRGWVEPAARDEYLQSLPDVSDKIAPAAEEIPED